ncbi:MAG: T9SS type A sorting domain-containing protein [Bacteroidota bacterium]
MKTILLLPAFFYGLIQAALPPQSIAPLYDHLHEVNAQWQYQTDLPFSLSETVFFTDDTERIHAHLERVILLLRQRQPELSEAVLARRLHLLDQLATYSEARQFPQNLFHAQRQPYFIDHEGTACAVGHLLQKSGFEAFAEKVSREMNYAYVMDMPYPELGSWALSHGFTKEELALIQPGYSPTITWNPVGHGTDGTVRHMYHDPASQRLYVAGDFDWIDSVAAHHIALSENGQFQPMGGGLDGEITSMQAFNGKLYVGGYFTNGKNIAVWDGNAWSYEQAISDTVTALAVFQNELYATGAQGIGMSGTQTGFFAKKQNGQWLNKRSFEGPAYCMTNHNSRLYIGGALSPASFHPYFAAYTADGNAVIPATQSFERLDAPIRDFASDGTFLYAVGDLCDDQQNPTFGFARLGNSGWELLYQKDLSTGNFNRRSFKKVMVHQNQVLVSGNFQLTPFVGIYGGGVAKLVYQGSYSFLEAVSILDTTVHAMAEMNGELLIGGAFDSLGTTWDRKKAGHLLKTDQFTGLFDTDISPLSLHPNPMETHSRTILAGSGPLESVALFDVKGQQVSVPIHIRGREIEIERGNLAPGMYFVRVKGADQQLGQGKLLVR